MGLVIAMLLVPVMIVGRPPAAPASPIQAASESVECRILRAEIEAFASDLYLLNVARAQIEVAETLLGEIASISEVVRTAIDPAAVDAGLRSLVPVLKTINQTLTLRNAWSKLQIKLAPLLELLRRAVLRTRVGAAIVAAVAAFSTEIAVALTIVSTVWGVSKGAAVLAVWLGYVPPEDQDYAQAAFLLAFLSPGYMRFIASPFSESIRAQLLGIEFDIDNKLEELRGIGDTAERLRVDLFAEQQDKVADLAYFQSTGQCDAERNACADAVPRPVEIIDLVPIDLEVTIDEVERLLLDQQNLDLDHEVESYDVTPLPVPRSPHAPRIPLIAPGNQADTTSGLAPVIEHVNESLDGGKGVVVVGGDEQADQLNTIAAAVGDHPDGALSFLAVSPDSAVSDPVSAVDAGISASSAPPLTAILGGAPVAPAREEMGFDGELPELQQVRQDYEQALASAETLGEIGAAAHQGRLLDSLTEAERSVPSRIVPPNESGGVGSLAALTDAVGRAECPDYDPPDRSAGQAGSYGHPSLVTFDGVSFAFHGAGDFLLAESIDPSIPLRMVARFARLPGDNMASVSFNRALGVEVGDTTITIGDSGAAGQQQPFDAALLRLDGQDVSMDELRAGPRTFTGGQVLLVEGDDGDRYEITLDDGTVIAGSSQIGGPFTVRLSPRRSGLMRGMLGDADGDTGNDVATAGGVVVSPSDYDALYEGFGRSWLVKDTPFVAPLAAVGAAPAVPPRPVPATPQSLADFPSDVVAQAMQQCEQQGVPPGSGLSQCAFDLSITRDASWIGGSRSVGWLTGEAVDSAVVAGDTEDRVSPEFPLRVDGRGRDQGIGVLEDGARSELYVFDVPGVAALHVSRCALGQESGELVAVLLSPGRDPVAKIPLADCRPAVVRIPAPGRYQLVVVDVAKRGGTYALDLDLTELGPRLELQREGPIAVTGSVGGDWNEVSWLVNSATGGPHVLVVEQSEDGCDLEGTRLIVARMDSGEEVWAQDLANPSCRALGPFSLDPGVDYAVTLSMANSVADRLRVRTAVLFADGHAELPGHDFRLRIEPQVAPVATGELDGNGRWAGRGRSLHDLARERWMFDTAEVSSWLLQLRPDWCAPGVQVDAQSAWLELADRRVKSPEFLFVETPPCTQVVRFGGVPAGDIALMVRVDSPMRGGFGLEVMAE